ncbi:MAG: Fibrobacter succinos major domain (Fib succ major) [Bacteroidetes bacterium]|nr:Fibrobacter succinos major domain (Fib succ major) [Bacteroidota bacterium]
MLVFREKANLFLVLFFFLLSCTKENNIPNDNSGEKASFFASVRGIPTKTPIDIGESIPNGGTVGIFALSYSGDNESSVEWPSDQDSYQLFNLEGEIQEGTPQTIKTTTACYFMNNGQKIAFYSYYPRETTPVFNSGNPPTIDVNISSSPSAQKDYLWATPVTGTYLAPDINFVYNHALSLVRIKIHKTCVEELTLKKIVITTAQKQKATMNIATGEMTTTNLLGGNTDFSLSDLSFTIPLQGSAEAPLVLENGKFLFIPNTIITSIKAYVRISGEFFDREFSIVNPALNLNKGAAINVLINISKIGIVIANWDEITEETGTIGEVPSANSYIVTPNSSLIINVGIKGNGNADATAATGLSITHTAASVAVLWQTTDGLVTCTDFDAVNQTIKVNTPLENTSGNAVIAAFDGENGTGNILWSWHIWITNYNPNNGTIYYFNPDNPLAFMDRNLGAIDNTPGQVGTKGLLYQWGRKDPFPGSTTIDGTTEPTLYGAKTSVAKTPVAVANNLANSILNPITFYCGVDNSNTGYDWYTSINNRANQNDALWGSSNPYGTPTAKTIFDPCPAGWRVPAFKINISPWSVLTNTNGSFADYGRTWTTPYSTGFYPAAGGRDRSNGIFFNVGLYSYIWSASICSDLGYDHNGLHLGFSSDNVYLKFPSNRAYGFSVRCVRE